MRNNHTSIATTIAPWFSIENAAKAVDFYKNAFDAVETYRLEIPDSGGLVLKLSVNGAEFWISGNNENESAGDKPIIGDAIRMILTVDDPDALFTKAIEAGASVVFPISEEHGWKLGRIVDPFGIHWEIGHPLSP